MKEPACTQTDPFRVAVWLQYGLVSSALLLAFEAVALSV